MPTVPWSCTEAASRPPARRAAWRSFIAASPGRTPGDRRDARRRMAHLDDHLAPAGAPDLLAGPAAGLDALLRLPFRKVYFGGDRKSVGVGKECRARGSLERYESKVR